jgi:hypothetical protein
MISDLTVYVKVRVWEVPANVAMREPRRHDLEGYARAVSGLSAEVRR